MDIPINFNPFVALAKRRCLLQNKNFMGVFLGSTGSGKSYACLDYAIDTAKECNTGFSVLNNVAFSFKRLMELTQQENNQAPGTVFILEEIGTVGSGGSSHEWQSKANSFLSSFMQKDRHRNRILLFNTPNFALLQKQSRMLIHFICVMKYIDKPKNRSVGNIKLCQTNPISGKTYLKHLRITYNGDKVCVPDCSFKLPPESYIKEYEVLKEKFSKDMDEKIIKSFNDGCTPDTNPKKIIDSIIDLKRKNLSNNAMARVLGVSTRTIGRHLAQFREISGIRPQQFNFGRDKRGDGDE